MTEEQRYRYWLAVHALAEDKEYATIKKGVNNGEKQQTNHRRIGKGILQEVSDTEYLMDGFCKKMVESD